jgi:hypothetical protein
MTTVWIVSVYDGRRIWATAHVSADAALAFMRDYWDTPIDVSDDNLADYISSDYGIAVGLDEDVLEQPVNL